MEYNRKKKNDIKKWLLGGNAKIYGIILVVFIVAVLFMFKTVNSMFKQQSQSTENSDDTIQETTAPFVLENQSYLIKVNKSNNFITVYKKGSKGDFDQPFKTFRCSVNTKVETGDTVITDKNIWRKLSDGSYGHYASKLENSGVIASVPYSVQDISKLNTAAYNNLGKAASAGYIYLASADAQWIYENCGNNTTVTIYEDESEQPVIELSEFVKLAAGSTYDPTDQTAQIGNNSSNVKIDFMRGVYDCTIALNEPFDKWENIYARDINGNDITSKITIDGDVDVTVPGTYTLIYYLSDNYGTNLSYYRYVTVEEGPEQDTGHSAGSTEPETKAPVSPSTDSGNGDSKNTEPQSKTEATTQKTTAAPVPNTQR